MLFSRPENQKGDFTKLLALRQSNVRRTIEPPHQDKVFRQVSINVLPTSTRAVSDLAFFCIIEPSRTGESIMATTKQNLQSLRDEFGALTAEVAKLMEASDQHNADELKDRIAKLRAKFEGAVSGAGNSGSDPIHELSENIADVVEGSLRERPIATLAVALGLGFIIGATLRG